MVWTADITQMAVPICMFNPAFVERYPVQKFVSTHCPSLASFQSSCGIRSGQIAAIVVSQISMCQPHISFALTAIYGARR